jgi:hypothetical protein
MRAHTWLTALVVQAACASAPDVPRPDRAPVEGAGSGEEGAAAVVETPTVAGAPEPVEFTLTPGSDRAALLLGVSGYEVARDGFAPLQADQDHEVMARALGKQGFPEGNIVRLHDAHATRDHVLAAMARMAEQIESSEDPIRLAVVYYAGHGQQVTDQNGDEADGYDEALVLWGAHAKDPAGSYHLRDDDFGAALVRIQRALGPRGHLLVVMDMCHSGNASRSAAPTRGGVPPAGPPAKTARGASSVEEDSPGFEGSPSGDLATRVVLSAARADEHAREIKVTYAGKRRSLGALTYALVGALDALSGAQTLTYRDLFADVVHVVGMKSRSQTPQLEGPRDLALFGGRRVVAPASFSVEKALGGGRFRVAAGRLVGLDVGARVSLHRPGEAGGRFAAARVVEADELEATLAIEGPADALPTTRAVASARVVVDGPVFTDARLGVAVEPDDARALLEERAPFLRVDPASDYVLRVADGALVLEHVTSEPEAARGGEAARGERVFAIALPDGGLGDEGVQSTLLATLRALAQVDYLGAHTSRGEGLSARLGVTRYRGAGGCEGAPLGRTEGGVTARVERGASFEIDVTNTGEGDAFVYVVLLSSDRSAFLLYPPPDEASDGARVEAGARAKTPYCIGADTPGRERVRVFVSPQPLALPALFGGGGAIDLEALASGAQRPKSAAGVEASDDPRALLEASGASKGRARSRGLTTSNLLIEIVDAP